MDRKWTVNLKKLVCDNLFIRSIFYRLINRRLINRVDIYTYRHNISVGQMSVYQNLDIPLHRDFN